MLAMEVLPHLHLEGSAGPHRAQSPFERKEVARDNHLPAPSHPLMKLALLLYKRHGGREGRRAVTPTTDRSERRARIIVHITQTWRETQRSPFPVSFPLYSPSCCYK